MDIRDTLPEAVLLAGEPELAAHRPAPDAPRAERDAWFSEHMQCRAVRQWGRCRYGVRLPHRDLCAACAGPSILEALDVRVRAALAPRPTRTPSSLDGVPRAPWPEEKLAGTVALSNKGCPRYYEGTGQCRCPEERCWYDAQLARRARSLPALTPEGWARMLEGEVVDS